MQTGWPEVEVPFYGWCGHVDGIWSGGAGAPQGRDDPEFDPVRWNSEPAVNGHDKNYGSHASVGLNVQLFSALVGVSLSDQSQAGMLTQEAHGGRPAPLASRLHRIPTQFLLNLHGI